MNAASDDRKVRQVHALIRTSFELLSDVRNVEALNRAAYLLELAQQVVEELVIEGMPQ